MKLSIENIKLNGALNVLDKLSLKGLKSIHRTRLLEKLKEELQRVAKEENALRKEYSHLDDEGEPLVKEDSKGRKVLDLKDEAGFKDAIAEFYKEKIIIDSGDSQVTLKSVKRSLEESEEEWQGEEAYDFADLYEAFEGNTEDE